MQVTSCLSLKRESGKELATALFSYQSTHSNNYPHPADIDSCNSANIANCTSAVTVCIGKIPVTQPGMPLVLPAWFSSNNWFDVIYYSAGTNSLSGGAGSGSIGWAIHGKGYGGLSGTGTTGGAATGSGTGCYATTLSVSNTSINALFLMPGAPIGSLTRTGLTSSSLILSQYFEDPENQNLNDLYVMPTATTNDLLYTLP